MRSNITRKKIIIKYSISQLKERRIDSNRLALQTLRTRRLNTLVIHHLSTWIPGVKSAIILYEKIKIGEKKWIFCYFTFLSPAPPFLSPKWGGEQKHRKGRPWTWPKPEAVKRQIGVGLTAWGQCSAHHTLPSCPQHPHRWLGPHLQYPSFPPQNHPNPHSTTVFVWSVKPMSSELFQLSVIGNAMQKIKYVNSSLCLPSILKGQQIIIFLPCNLKELQPQRLLGEQLVQKAATGEPVRAHE